MSDAYQGARLIGTAGFTLGVTQGIFQGIINGVTAQNIFIQGSYIFDGSTKRTYKDAISGITFFANAGQTIPVKCTRIVPATGTVLGVFD